MTREHDPAAGVDEESGPAGAATVAELAGIREQIGDIDRTLVELLARRSALARRAGAIKRDAGMGALDPGREAVVLRQMTELAREHGLHTEDARDVFWAIIGMCRRAQTEDT